MKKVQFTETTLFVAKAKIKVCKNNFFTSQQASDPFKKITEKVTYCKH